MALVTKCFVNAHQKSRKGDAILPIPIVAEGILTIEIVFLTTLSVGSTQDTDSMHSK